MSRPTEAYQALMGQGPKRIPQWEHLSNPDFEHLATGIDPYEKPRSAKLKLQELYHFDMGLGTPADDEPIPRPTDGGGSVTDEEGMRRVRWGAQTTGHWDWGKQFPTIEDVLAYEPLEHLDMRDRGFGHVVESRDYSGDDDTFIEREYPGAMGQEPPEGEIQAMGFYNTVFMWPLLTFGWERFLELAGGYPDQTKRIMGDFAELSRKVFRCFAKMPINMVTCHDDLCMATGPVCSPAWLREHVYPYYEEFWDMLHAGGKKVLFMCDGNIDKVADDVAACGADGFISEPVTDWKALAAKYPSKVLAGEGDNRILSGGDRGQIEAMVDRMVDTAGTCAGYFMQVGNHIPWNVPAPHVKLYMDLVKERAFR